MRRHILFGLSVGAIAVISGGCEFFETKQPVNPTALIEAATLEQIDSLMFAQKIYFLENQSFTTSFNRLKMSMPLETQNYQFKLTPQPNAGKGMAVTAIAKNPNFRSFTGVVFAVPTGKDTMTVSQICQTSQASVVPPAIPKVPTNLINGIQCTKGSRAAYDYIAQN